MNRAHEKCLFRSAAAKEALGVEQSEWVVEQCTVSENGRPSCCAGQLQVLSAAGSLFTPSALPTLRIQGTVHVPSAIGPARQQCRQQTLYKADIKILGFVFLVLVARHKGMPYDSEGFIAHLEPN